MPTNTKALQVAEPAGIVAGKNAVINGGFDIWQRGTSNTSFAVNNSGSYVTADRWNIGSNASVNLASSRQTADNTNNQYALRWGRVSGQTATGVIRATNALETVNSIPLAGKTVTISFYAKKGADAPSALTVYMYGAPVTDQSPSSIFNGWTNANFTSQANTVTTTSTKFTFTTTIPSNYTQVAVIFDYTATGTAGANEWMQIESVQLELGSVATPFSRAGGTIQGELAACQRYYEQSAAAGTTLSEGMSATVSCLGGAYSASDFRTQRITFITTKRVVPTMTYYRSNDGTTNGRWCYYTTSWQTPSSFSNEKVTQDSFTNYMSTSSAFTTRDCYIVEGGGWTASAEL